MNIQDPSIVIDGNNYNAVNPSHGLIGTDGWGQPSMLNPPQTVLPKQIYTEKYSRISNALPFGCPAGYTPGFDNVAMPRHQYGRINFKSDIDTSLSTGLPVCTKQGETKQVCYPQDISLMGQTNGDILYDERGITKCTSALGKNPIQFIDNVPVNGKCDSVDAAKKICDSHADCKGFYIAKKADENGKEYLGCRFVSDGLKISTFDTPNIAYMKDVKVVGGVKYDTYIKNTNASDYNTFPTNTLFGYDGREGFVGGLESGMCLKNLLLLVLVAVLTGVIIRRMRA